MAVERVRGKRPRPARARPAAASASPGPPPLAAIDAESLLRGDWFVRIRTDEELDRFVEVVTDRTSRPYTALWRRLVGAAGTIREREAKELWAVAVEHRRALAQTLGRPVHLRVAALDLVYRHPTAARPVVLAPAVVQDLVRLGTTDALTGLANRERFLSILGHELRQRNPHRLILAFADVDGFKEFNDTRGHAYGDEVLRTVAAALQATARTGDVVARLGGDEFAILLVEAERKFAREYLRRAGRALRDAGWDVSLSVGLAASREGDTPEKLLERADRAMYRKKRSSRARRRTPERRKR